VATQAAVRPLQRSVLKKEIRWTGANKRAKVEIHIFESELRMSVFGEASRLSKSRDAVRIRHESLLTVATIILLCGPRALPGADAFSLALSMKRPLALLGQESALSVPSRNMSQSHGRKLTSMRLYDNNSPASIAHFDKNTFNLATSTSESISVPPEKNEKTAIVAPSNTKLGAIIITAVSSSMIISMFAILMSLSGPGGWRYYVAGGICASVSHAITTPIDVVKTRQQVTFTEHPESFVKAMIRIIREDGMSEMFAGLGPTTVGYLLEGAIKFGMYEILKPLIRKHVTSSTLLGYSLCATASGIAASILLCPMEAIRIRLVAEPSFREKYGGLNGGIEMLRSEGIRGMFKGLSAMIAKQVPYTITKQVAFDCFAKMLHAWLKGLGIAMNRKTMIAVPLFSAMAASSLSCVSSQPGDMLLSLVNAQEGKKATRDFSKEIYQKDGFSGFFVGMKARFLHVGLIVTMQLLIYDIVKRLCGIAATGT
jgi:solute carrier family 25 phosphate transporter 3